MVAHLDAVTCLSVDPNGLYLMSGSESPAATRPGITPEHFPDPLKAIPAPISALRFVFLRHVKSQETRKFLERMKRGKL